MSRGSFKPGPDPRRVIPHYTGPKIYRRLKMMLLEKLMEPADMDACCRFGLPYGRTSWNDLRAHTLVRAACGMSDVDVAAQRLLAEVVSEIELRGININVLNIDPETAAKAMEATRLLVTGKYLPGR